MEHVFEYDIVSPVFHNLNSLLRMAITEFSVENKKSRKEMAEIIGITEINLSRFMTGKSNLKNDTVTKVLQNLGYGLCLIKIEDSRKKQGV